MRRGTALFVVALLWVGVGVYGAASYGRDYLTYRGFSPPKDPPGIAHGRLWHESFYSPAMRSRRRYVVYTPPGYAAAAARGVRFPVLYLLHGSPGSPMQFINVARVGVALDVAVDAHLLRPFVVVAPSGSDGTFRSDTEWADTPHGRYEGLVLDVVRSVDSRFATARNRSLRAIAGNSEGGYGAVNIALRHPGTFAIAESWSGYFSQSRKGPFAKASPASVRANDPSAYVTALRPVLRRYPFHAYLYDGTREPTAVKRAGAAFAAALRREGAHVTYRVFRGGHDWRLWRGQTPRMLAFAGRWFGARR